LQEPSDCRIWQATAVPMNQGRFNCILQTIFCQLEITQVPDQYGNQFAMMLTRGIGNGLPRGTCLVSTFNQDS
jgi:hypothetical protein